MRPLLRRGEGPGPAAERAPRGGFTLVELLTVAVVMGTLGRMAAPNLHEVVVRTQAAEVAADLESVRAAVMSYQHDHLAWPADAYTGQVPEGLTAFLPDGFSFVGAGYRLDWQNWAVPSGLPGEEGTHRLLAVSVVTADRELGQALARILRRSLASYTLDDTYTFVVDRE